VHEHQVALGDDPLDVVFEVRVPPALEGTEVLEGLGAGASGLRWMQSGGTKRSTTDVPPRSKTPLRSWTTTAFC
jgi:hypothetical protein